MPACLQQSSTEQLEHQTAVKQRQATTQLQQAVQALQGSWQAA